MSGRLAGRFRDECEIGSLPGIDDITDGNAHAQPYTYGGTKRCRHSRTSTREVLNGADTAVTNVDIRLPLGTKNDKGVALSNSDRIRLTRLNGARVSEVHAILGEPWETRSQLVTNCVRLIGNSAK